MTNREAINILQNAAWLGTDTNREKVEEAVRIAVSAINATTWVSCDDRLPEATDRVLICTDGKVLTVDGSSLRYMVGKWGADDMSWMLLPRPNGGN